MGIVDRAAEFQRLRALRAAGVGVPLAAGVRVCADSRVGTHARIGRDASLHRSTLGRRSYVGRATALSFADVGAFCAIAWNASVGAPNHPLDRATVHGFPYLAADGGFVQTGEPPEARTWIGNDVWIGANAVVLPGVIVADGAVIGAQAAVTRNVAPYAIVAGVPARQIRHRVPEDLVERLRAVGWWNWPDDILRQHLHLFQRRADEEVVAALEAVQPGPGSR